MPALPPYLIEPIWEQLAALLPERERSHPLGCHRPRIPDRVVFEKLVQVLVFGCAYEKIADERCSATTLRRRRDEWILAGVVDALREMALEAYDRMVGLELSELAVGGAHQLLVQRPQEASVVHGAAGAGGVDFWVALSDVVIIVRRLVREGWSRYRWEGRPSRRP